MRQTLAIFVDAYRELNSKKLFWISMAISLAVVLALAIPRQTPTGMAIFGAKLDAGPFQLLSEKAVSPSAFYKFIYSWFGINLWLGWGATILALISTASMIPDLVSSGSIELTLSKPLARLRLFLTKYAAGLVFVGLQAAVFAVGTVLAIGIRSGTWDLRPLLVVPIMILFFSFLHCVSVLVGLVTRSTLMALIAVVLVWLGIWAVQTVEGVMLDQRVQSERQVTRTSDQLASLRTGLEQFKAQLQRLEPPPPPPPPPPPRPPRPPRQRPLLPRQTRRHPRSRRPRAARASSPPRRPVASPADARCSGRRIDCWRAVGGSSRASPRRIPSSSGRRFAGTSRRSRRWSGCDLSRRRPPRPPAGGTRACTRSSSRCPRPARPRSSSSGGSSTRATGTGS